MKTQELKQQKIEGAICPVCDASMAPWISVPGDWRRPQVKGTYDIVRCPSCAFGRLDPVPDAASVAESYDLDEYYTHADKREPTARPFTSRLKSHLAWRFDHGTEPNDAWLDQWIGKGLKRACDVGCGGGDLLLKLEHRGIEAVGVEPDDAARNFAVSKGATVFSGTAEDLPAELGGNFDAVFMSHVLEHTRDCMKALRNLYDILTPGGYLCVEVPNNTCRGLESAGTSWYWLDAPRHLNFFSESNLRSAARSAGFAVESVEYRGYSRQFEYSWENAERQIHRYMNERSASRCARAKHWTLLWRTIFAPEAEKYDSIRLIARKPVEG
jgi:SAM-dependent methyltransferase